MYAGQTPLSDPAHYGRPQTRGQINDVANLLRDPALLRACPNGPFRKWIVNHLTLNATEYGPGVSYRTRGLLVGKEDLYDVICDAHQTKSDGHAGRDKTTAAIQAGRKWVLKALVELFIGLCPHCNERNALAKRSKLSKDDEDDATSFDVPSVLRTAHQVISPTQGPSGLTVPSVTPYAALPGSIGVFTPFIPSSSHHHREISTASSAYSFSTDFTLQTASTDDSPPALNSLQEPVFSMPPSASGLFIGQDAFERFPEQNVDQTGDTCVFGQFPQSGHDFIVRQAPSAHDTLSVGFQAPSPTASPPTAFATLLALERDRSDLAVHHHSPVARYAVNAHASLSAMYLGPSPVAPSGLATAAPPSVPAALTTGDPAASGSGSCSSVEPDPNSSLSTSASTSSRAGSIGITPSIGALTPIDLPVELPSKRRFDSNAAPATPGGQTGERAWMGLTQPSAPSDQPIDSGWMWTAQEVAAAERELSQTH